MVAEIVDLSYDTGKELSLGLEKMTSNAGLTPVYEEARKSYLQELINERPEYDAVQFALMERASYLHARMKQREASGAFSNDQNYTSANKTILDVLTLLKKTDTEKEDRDKFQQQFMSTVADAVKYAIKDLDENTQGTVMSLLRLKFEELLGG